MFDALSMLAHAASEAAIEPHEAFVESPREAGSAPSSTSIDSASTMTFSPQLKHQTLERECPPVRHLRETTEENQAPAIEDEAIESAPSSPGRAEAGCTEYECGYCGERKISTSSGGSFTTYDTRLVMEESESDVSVVGSMGTSRPVCTRSGPFTTRPQDTDDSHICRARTALLHVTPENWTML